MTTTAATRIALDWSGHKPGTPRPCRICKTSAIMRDEHGKACHKVCAEAEAAARIGAATSAYIDQTNLLSGVPA